MSLSPSLVGRHVQRALAGYGHYYAVVTSVDEANGSACLLNEFGDEESLTLAQVTAALQPEGFNPVTDDRWTIQEPRRRKPTEKALSQKLFDEAVKFERQLRKKERAGSGGSGGGGGRAAAAAAAAAANGDDSQEDSAAATATATATTGSANAAAAWSHSSAAQSSSGSHSHTPPDDGFVDVDDSTSASWRNRSGGSGKRLTVAPPSLLGQHRAAAVAAEAGEVTDRDLRSTTKPKIIHGEIVDRGMRVLLKLLDGRSCKVVVNQSPQRIPTRESVIARYISEATMILESHLAAGLPLTETLDPNGYQSPVAHQGTASGKRKPGKKSEDSPASKKSQGEDDEQDDDTNGQEDHNNNHNESLSDSGSRRLRNRRAWTRCDACHRKHWNDQPCPEDPLLPDDAQGAAAGSDQQTLEKQRRMTRKTDTGLLPVALTAIPKRWGGATTSTLLEILKATRNAAANGEANGDEDSVFKLAGPLQQPPIDISEVDVNDQPFGDSLVRQAYRTVAGKVDVMCGADGRYGITGNTTLGSFSQMLNYLQENCELSGESTFIDLGHGMGRPNFHIATMANPVKFSVGTEFNPMLYKQSMLALREFVTEHPLYAAVPRIFFMDSNIKDFTSLNGFTHLYVFNIGMPADLMDHIYDLFSKCNTAKYAVIYPHGPVTIARVQELGTIMETMSMKMPGGCSYVGYIVRLKQYERRLEEGSPQDLDLTMDADIKDAFEILSDNELYRLYLAQLGTATALDTEETQVKFSRAFRRHAANTAFLELSPCLPDIDLGLLRRVCLALGVSTVGTKVRLLANIQDYVPETFSISMFAVGSKYTPAHVEDIVKKLLARPPTRRQPELN